MPAKWQRIYSPGGWQAFLLAGVTGLIIPFFFVGLLVVVSVLDDGRNASSGGAISWIAVLLPLLLFIPAHEFLHALGYPGKGMSDRTTLVIWPIRLRIGVYYDGCLSRPRWIMMRLLPLILLSILPAALLVLFRYMPVSNHISIFLQLLMLVNGVGSGGDVVAVGYVWRQVPAGADICFHGGKAYWRAVCG